MAQEQGEPTVRVRGAARNQTPKAGRNPPAATAVGVGHAVLSSAAHVPSAGVRAHCHRLAVFGVWEAWALKPPAPGCRLSG